jgi:hypothetical protein
VIPATTCRPIGSELAPWDGGARHHGQTSKIGNEHRMVLDNKDDQHTLQEWLNTVCLPFMGLHM